MTLPAASKSPGPWLALLCASLFLLALASLGTMDRGEDFAPYLLLGVVPLTTIAIWAGKRWLAALAPAWRRDCRRLAAAAALMSGAGIVAAAASCHRSFEVLVLDSHTLQPLPGATVVLRDILVLPSIAHPAELELPGPRGRTGADGRVRLSSLFMGRMPMMEIAKDGYVDMPTLVEDLNPQGPGARPILRYLTASSRTSVESALYAMDIAERGYRQYGAAMLQEATRAVEAAAGLRAAGNDEVAPAMRRLCALLADGQRTRVASACTGLGDD